MNSQTIINQIVKTIHGHGRGWVFTGSDFAKPGSSAAAVRQALVRLTRAGKIKRLARGIYYYPEMNRLVGEVPPAPVAIGAALARANGAVLQPTEGAAANALGLTTQVPGRLVLLSNATPRTRWIGKTAIQFKRAAPKRMIGAGTPAGTVIQGLRFLGPEGAKNKRVVKRLRAALPVEEREALRRLTPNVAEWMRSTLNSVTSSEGDAKRG